MQKLIPVIVVALFLICVVAVIIALTFMRRSVLAGKIEKVLGFQDLKIDKCSIKSLHTNTCNTPEFSDRPKTETPVLLKGNEANAFAQAFSAKVRKYCTEVRSKFLAEFIFDYQIMFESPDCTWEFQFGYVPHETLVEYRLCFSAEIDRPSYYGLMILKKEAGLELERFITSKFRED